MQGDSFTAEGSDGREHTVHIHTTSVTVSSPLGTTVVPGPPDLRTSDGLRAVRLEGRRYRIDGTGVILVSESKDAP